MRSIAGEPDARQIGHVICSQSFTAARVRSKLPDNQVGEPFRVALIVRVIEVRISKHVRFESPRPRKSFLRSDRFAPVQKTANGEHGDAVYTEVAGYDSLSRL